MTNPIAPSFINPLDTNMSPTTYPSVLPIGPFQTYTPSVRESITTAAQERAAPPALTAPQPGVAQPPASAPITIAPISPTGIINTIGNPLNAFANYTYHIRFSLVNQSQAYGDSIGPNTDLSSLNRYIIAESGATAAFNISRFSFMNTVSPSFRNQNQSLLTWKMTINEPYGLTLPDYILNAARSTRIGVKNSHRFPFFIELWFTGYDEAGNIIEPSVARRIWRVMMLDFDLETTIAGTTYNIHGIADNATGTANQYAFPPTSLQLTGLNTFGDAVNKLQETLNNAAKGAENRNAATTYEIQVPNQLRAWKLVDTSTNTQPGTASDTAGRGTTIPINRGQDIGTFMMTLVSKCGADADNFLKGVQGSSAVGSSDTRGLGRILQVFTEVKLGEYVDALNDYKKTIIIRMVPFYTPRIVATPDDAKKQLDKAVQQRKLADLQSFGLLAKQYDYQYTGLNTEIIRFDVKVENFWAITLPTYLGAGTWAQNHVGPVLDPNSVGAANNRQTAIRFNNDNILPSPIADIANRIPTNITSGFGSFGSIASSFGVGSAASPFGNMTSAGGIFGGLSSGITGGMNNSIQGLATNAIGNLAGSGPGQSQLIRGLSSVINAGIPRFDAQTSGIIQNIANTLQRTGALSGITSAANSTLQSLAANTRGLTYLEDIKAQIEASSDASTDALRVAFQVDPSPMGQNAANNANERKLQTQTVRGFPVGQTMFGQTIGNLYDQKFMLEIDLTIRGDPYWIGNGNLEDNLLSRRLLDLTNQGNLQAVSVIMRDRANYLIGENMFLLRFRTGGNYREDTGFMDFDRSSDYFNGIYAVLEVENKFENGSFTQDLKAYKELFSQKTSRDLTTGAGAPAPPSGSNNVPAQPPAAAPTATTTPLTAPTIDSVGATPTQIGSPTP